MSFKFILILFSHLFDIADKKRKRANSFPNTSYQKTPSKVVKPVEKWVMKDLICKDITQIIYENLQFLT